MHHHASCARRINCSRLSTTPASSARRRMCGRRLAQRHGSVILCWAFRNFGFEWASRTSDGPLHVGARSQTGCACLGLRILVQVHTRNQNLSSCTQKNIFLYVSTRKRAVDKLPDSSGGFAAVSWSDGQFAPGVPSTTWDMGICTWCCCLPW